MTAIKKFSRLEAKAVWKENGNSPPRSVIVSFGKSSIIISNENAFPLDHWSFNSIVMISKSKGNTIFSQGSNKFEKLVIEDDEMINAIILVCNLKNKSSWSIFKFRKLFKFLFFFFFLSIFFYFPNFLREIIFEITDPKYEIIYYDNALNEFTSTIKICNKNLSIKKFEKKINQFFISENFIEIIIVKYGVDQPESMNGEKVESYSQIGIPTRGGGLRSPIGKEIYTRIIRPIFMENYSCYRTYVINKIASVRLVEYDMDIVKSGMSRVSPDEVKKRMEDAIGGEVSSQINKRGKK